MHPSENMSTACVRREEEEEEELEPPAIVHDDELPPDENELPGANRGGGGGVGWERGWVRRASSNKTRCLFFPVTPVTFVTNSG